MEDFEELGTQFDGEPVAVEPVPVPEEEKAPEVVEPEVTEEAETEEEEAPKKKTGSQRARERALKAEARAEMLEEQLRQAQAKTLPAVISPDGPKQEEFETHAEWVKASVRFEAARMIEEEKQKEQSKKWQEADAKFGQTKPDWDDAIEDLRDTVKTFTPKTHPGFHALDMALSSSEMSSALKYHLGKNTSELDRLAAMDPIQAVKELGKLEARLSEPPKPTKKPTQAPPPISPVVSSGVVAPVTHHARFEEF